jgi:hypothetical protein
MERFVLLALPGPPGWDDRLRRCLAPGPVAVELIFCRSADELAVRLASGRPCSAVIAPAPVDGCAGPPAVPIVVLTSNFSLDELLAELARVGARPIACRDRLPALALPPATPPAVEPGRLVAVCGPGGTGASTVAMALASGLPRAVLADFALRADQLVLHGLAPETRWGLREFLAFPRFPDLRILPGCGYRLLPGLRRPSHWTLVRPGPFDRALGVLRTVDVVADITGDFEGEAETGSIDVEERNHMARRTASLADLVVIVAGPGEKGRHALDRLVTDLLALGVDPSRIVPIINRSKAGELHLPDVAGDDVASALAPAVWAYIGPLLDRSPARPPLLPAEPVPVSPGSLGSWSAP